MLLVELFVMNTNWPPLSLTSSRNSFVPLISLCPIQTVPSISRRKSFLFFSMFHLPAYRNCCIRIVGNHGFQPCLDKMLHILFPVYSPDTYFQTALLPAFQEIRHIQMVQCRMQSLYTCSRCIFLHIQYDVPVQIRGLSLRIQPANFLNTVVVER